ncbi:hypothetical protein Y032_0298g1759 [Ancylostoma ceylanicum]|uniref:G-protein coupled receptors family 1 profile domain-containing protein n=1 Tax=Ancylostoma ceylanicum TaxID=53326 RepID=A0A016S4M8_9BILA|nr:hypothetical protein Y032_0298g1759 [Ancylostoma ceylanicum]
MEACKGSLCCIYGISILITSIVLITVYIPVLRVMQYPQFKKYFAYRLLSLLGLCDCVMLVSHFIASISLATQYTLPFALNKILGSIFFSAWTTLMIVSTAVFVNRLSVVVFHQYSQYIFSETNNKLIFASIFLAFLTTLVLLLLPEFDYMYNPHLLIWVPSTNQKVIQNLIRYKNILMFTTVLTGAVCYALIIVFVLTTVRGRKTKFDKAVTLQVSFNLIWTISNYIYWSFIHPSLFQYTLTARFVASWFWTFSNGVNPFIYLVVNKALRARVISFVRRKPEVIRTVTVFTAKTSPSKNTSLQR